MNPSGRHGSGPKGGYTQAERDALPTSDFLKPEIRRWPVSDKRHAEIALQYMAWGRGDRDEYPLLIKRLFAIPRYANDPELKAYYARLKPQIEARMARVNPVLPAGLYLIFDVHDGNYALREEDYVHLMRDGKLDWAGMAVEALQRIAAKRMGPPVEIQAVDDRGRMADLDMEKLHLLAEHTKLRRNPPPRSDGTDPAQNRAEIERRLASAPSDWKTQFRSGMNKRKATGQGGGSAMNIDNVLLILGITAGGNASGDVALGKNKVPPAVRAAAMKGLRLSHGNNYGAWDFIGIARGIQLATQPGVPDETLSRMSNYFGRHVKDQGSSNFGNDSNPSRGYMAWLNWGGDPGYEWASGKKRAKSNPPDITLDLGSMGRHPLYGSRHWGERVAERIQSAPLSVRKQFYEIYLKLRRGQTKERYINERLDIQFGGAKGKIGNYLIVAYHGGVPDMITVLLNQELISEKNAMARLVQADEIFSPPLSFTIERPKGKATTAAPAPEPTKPLTRRQREAQMMMEMARRNPVFANVQLSYDEFEQIFNDIVLVDMPAKQMIKRTYKARLVDQPFTLEVVDVVQDAAREPGTAKVMLAPDGATGRSRLTIATSEAGKLPERLRMRLGL